MTTSTTTTTINIVTPAQIAKCERVIDMTTGQAFYIVQSESDDTVEYTVRALKVNGRYFLTCTCKAGLSGTPCKHKRWASAAAQVDKTAAKVEAMSSTFAVATNVSDRTLERVMSAKPQATSGSQVEQDARHYNDNRPFRLMR